MDIVSSSSSKMDKVIDAFKLELSRVRTGRAHPSMLEAAKIEAYGSFMRLKELAAVTVADYNLLTITPFDRSVVKDVYRSLSGSDIDMIFSLDGNIVRAKVPMITEEYKKNILKKVAKDLEAKKVSIRSVRMDANATLKKMKKDSDITEDDLKRLSTEIQTLTDKNIKTLSNMFAEKESEIMSSKT